MLLLLRLVGAKGSVSLSISEKRSNCNAAAAAATGSFSHFLLSVKWSAIAAAHLPFSQQRLKPPPFLILSSLPPFFNYF